MPHYDLLLVELAFVAPLVALALFGFLDRALRLLNWRNNACSNNGVVATAEGILLPNQRNRLPHPGAGDAAADAAADTATNPATHAPTNGASAAPNAAASARRSG